MKKKDIQGLIDKDCKLTKSDGHNIYGKIISVSDDCLTFKTEKTTNVINIDAIQEIVVKDN